MTLAYGKVIHPVNGVEQITAAQADKLNEQLAKLPSGSATSPVPTEECPVELNIISRAGLPPLLPCCFEQAKLWAKGRTCLKLGRTHVLRRTREGFLVMEGRQIVNAYLAPVCGYYPPFYGSRETPRVRG